MFCHFANNGSTHYSFLQRIVLYRCLKKRAMTNPSLVGEQVQRRIVLYRCLKKRAMTNLNVFFVFEHLGHRRYIECTPCIH